jgi:hypothetical protein
VEVEVAQEKNSKLSSATPNFHQQNVWSQPYIDYLRISCPLQN